MELQSGESWENVPLEFGRLSTDSVKVSVALRSCDPSYPVFPRFVGLRMLMDPSKTQHRNRKDVDFRALKIDEIRHQSMTDISMGVFTTKRFQI